MNLFWGGGYQQEFGKGEEACYDYRMDDYYIGQVLLVFTDVCMRM